MRGYIAKFLKWVTSFFEVAVPNINVSVIEPVKVPEPIKEEPESAKEEKEEKKEEIKSEQESFDIYDPGERLVYKYKNGRKDFAASDPMVLYKKIMDVGPEISTYYQVAKSQSKIDGGAAKAHSDLIATVRGIFNVISMEQDPEYGLGEVETMQLMHHFLAYCNRLKKNSRTYQTTSKPSEDSSATSEQNDQATSNTSDYGSTENESFTDEPRPSPLEQE